MGAKRKSKVLTEWSADLAYAVGLIASDGDLSSNRRCVTLTSKDLENIINFRECLGVTYKIGRKARGGETEKKYYRVQISNVDFYIFLNSIGLTNAKSKTIQKVVVPHEFFRDFLRGCIDGDGTIIWSSHHESKHLQLRLRLYSASIAFLTWMKITISDHTEVTGGWIQNDRNGSCSSLCYGKTDSLKIIEFMYYEGARYYLTRKYNLIKDARVAKLADALALGASGVIHGGSSPLPRTT
jgi:hypothetical protein